MPFSFVRPLERITEKVMQKEVQERVLRQDELVVKVVEGASPSVVSIIATKDVAIVKQYFVDPFVDDPLFREFFGEGGSGFRVPRLREQGMEKQRVSAGSGFIVSSDGLVVTNRHVVAIEGAEYTVFLADGNKKIAQVLARDPVTDLAILKIEGSEFPSLKLFEGVVKIGQSAIAIGNALGEFSNTVSLGIVSGLHRSIIASDRGSSESLEELIQTDAAINPGNSGGPLLNLNGEVIGVNTAMAQGAENIGFAISAAKIARDVAQVKTQGSIVYPFLGVRYTAVTKEIAGAKKLGRDYGALLIASVEEPAVALDSPAAKAALKEGDIILEINGQRIDVAHTLASLIQQYRVGEEVKLKIFRNNEEIEMAVKLEERK